MSCVDGNHLAGRLLAAVRSAFGPLAEYGFRLEREPDPEDLRGAIVEVASDTVTLTITTDWWESDLQVWVTVDGANPLSIEALIREIPSIRRIPRSATRGVLQSRLTRV